MNIQALELRQQIYEFIQRQPGLHFRELQRRLKLAVGSLQHHITALEHEKLIIGRKDGEYTRYYSAGVVTDKDRFVLQFLRQRPVRHVCILLLQKKQANHAEISKHIGLSPATTSWYLAKLMQAGLVERQKKGREAYFKLLSPEETARVLITYKESFLDKLVDRFASLWEK